MADAGADAVEQDDAVGQDAVFAQLLVAQLVDSESDVAGQDDAAAQEAESFDCFAAAAVELDGSDDLVDLLALVLSLAAEL